jgi:hypothetical protein
MILNSTAGIRGLLCCLLLWGLSVATLKAEWTLPDEATWGTGGRIHFYATDQRALNAGGDLADEKADQWAARLRWRGWGAYPLGDMLTIHAGGRLEGRSGRIYSDEGLWLDVDQLRVTIENLMMTPMSLEVGRGMYEPVAGRLIENRDATWIMDGAFVRWDQWPWQLASCGGRVSGVSPETDVRNIWMMSFTREFDRHWCSKIDLYGGAVSMIGDADPYVVGARPVLYAGPAWRVWGELDGEWGTTRNGEDLAAVLAELHLLYKAERGALRPEIEAMTLWASGDDQPGGKQAFVPLLNEAAGGTVLRPRLTNLQLLNLAGRLHPGQRWRIELAGYYYWQSCGNADVMGDTRFGNGGYMAQTDGENRDLGGEVNLSVSLELDSGMRIECTGGTFFPGRAYSKSGRSAASEVCLSLSCEF